MGMGTDGVDTLNVVSNCNKKLLSPELGSRDPVNALVVKV